MTGNVRILAIGILLAAKANAQNTPSAARNTGDLPTSAPPTAVSQANSTPVAPANEGTATESSTAGANPAASETISTTDVKPSSDAQRKELEELKEEVRRLRADVDMSQASTDSENSYQRKIELYGFMDMGFQKLWVRNGSAAVGVGTSRASTFALGNVNLYIDANPNQTWRALTELRFTNYPNGNLEQIAVPSLGQNQVQTNTSIPDVNAPDPGWNNVNWGAFVLEQAWIQGTVTDWFGVRAGYWLTPFGIWNIDHGSPTLIGLTPPQFTRGRFYPQHQLGVQIVGQATSRSWTFGYTAYISNGKTRGTLDPTEDKAFGLRLTAQTMRPFPMTFGLAGYTGRYSQQLVSVSPATPLDVVTNEVVGYRQWDVGADVSLDIQKFRFRTELAIERTDYDGAKLELQWNIPGYYWPNRLTWGWYTISAYQLPWLGLEPYLSCELYRFPNMLSESIAVPGVGLNIHFNTEVQLKSQFTRVLFFDFNGAENHSAQNMSMLATRLVIAY